MAFPEHYRISSTCVGGYRGCREICKSCACKEHLRDEITQTRMDEHLRGGDDLSAVAAAFFDEEAIADGDILVSSDEDEEDEEEEEDDVDSEGFNGFYENDDDPYAYAAADAEFERRDDEKNPMHPISGGAFIRGIHDPSKMPRCVWAASRCVWPGKRPRNVNIGGPKKHKSRSKKPKVEVDVEIIYPEFLDEDARKQLQQVFQAFNVKEENKEDGGTTITQTAVKLALQIISPGSSFSLEELEHEDKKLAVIKFDEAITGKLKEYFTCIKHGLKNKNWGRQLEYILLAFFMKLLEYLNGGGEMSTKSAVTSATLHGIEWLCSEILDKFLACIYRDQDTNNYTRVMSTYFFRCIEADSLETALQYTAHWTADDLQRDIIVPINLENTHWIFVKLDPRAKFFYIVDSYRNERIRVQNLIRNWYKEFYNTKNRSNVPCDIDTWYVVWGEQLPQNLPRQLDGTSCGVFVAITVYYLLVQHRWPTRKDFTQGNISALRLFMLKVILDTNTMFLTQESENWFDSDAGYGRRKLRRIQ